MSESNFNNIQDFENNYELRKALNKLENELQKKEYELTSLTNLYQELKNLNERIKKENNDLTNKLNSERNEKNLLEKKFKNTIDTMESENSKKIDIYENKILKLSEYNPDKLGKNLEIENKFKQQILNKDKEIEELTQELNKCKHANELLLTEYETYKNDTIDEMNNRNQLHKSEINNLLEKIRLGENFKNLEDDKSEQGDNIIQLKNELDLVRRQLNELNNEIDKLRHDKEILTIERNDYKLNLVKLRDSQNFNQKKVEADLNRALNTIENMKNDINILNNTLKDKNFQINDLLKKNEALSDNINNKELEFQDITNMVQNLKKIIKTQDEDRNTFLIEREKTNQEMLIKERSEKEKYQKQLDQLNIKLKEAKSDDLIEKENEIDKLKEQIRIYKKEMQYDSNSRPYKDLRNQLKEMTDKKNEYKIQCKMANENMEKIIQILDEQQKKKFIDIVENTKNKYLKNNKLSGSGNDKSFN